MRDSVTALAIVNFLCQVKEEDRFFYVYHFGRMYCEELSHALLHDNAEVNTMGTLQTPASRFFRCVTVQDPLSHSRIALLLPPMSRMAFDLTFESSKRLQYEMHREAFTRCEIAKLLTVGGGWASLRKEKQALTCTAELHRHALAVADEKLAQKCWIFLGWGLLWAGALNQGVQIFKKQLELAVQWNDKVLEQQCHHALINAQTNPLIRSINCRVLSHQINNSLGLKVR